MCLPGETERRALDAADPNSFSATHLNIPESSGKASVITRVQTSSEIGRRKLWELVLVDGQLLSDQMWQQKSDVKGIGSQGVQKEQS